MMAIGKHSHFGVSFFIVLTLHEIYFSLTLMFNGLTQAKYYWWPILCTQFFELYYVQHISIIWHKNCVVQRTNLYISDPSIIWHINCYLQGQVCKLLLTKFVGYFWQSFTLNFVTVTYLTLPLISGDTIFFCANGAPYRRGCGDVVICNVVICDVVTLALVLKVGRHWWSFSCHRWRRQWWWTLVWMLVNKQLELFC